MKTTAHNTEKKNFRHTFFETCALVLISHPITWIIYIFCLSTLENQMLGDEIEPTFRWVMFGYSLLCMTVLGIVFAVLHYKDGKRHRAYLAATTVTDIGESAAAEGLARYRRIPLIESCIATVTTAVLWLPEVLFYTASVSSTGFGYGYGSALFIEDFYISFVGLCQPFQNAWLGWLIGLAYLFAFQYGGRVLSYRAWEKNRIRR